MARAPGIRYEEWTYSVHNEPVLHNLFDELRVTSNCYYTLLQTFQFYLRGKCGPAAYAMLCITSPFLIKSPASVGLVNMVYAFVSRVCAAVIDDRSLQRSPDQCRLLLQHIEQCAWKDDAAKRMGARIVLKLARNNSASLSLEECVQQCPMIDMALREEAAFLFVCAGEATDTAPSGMFLRVVSLLPAELRMRVCMAAVGATSVPTSADFDRLFEK